LAAKAPGRAIAAKCCAYTGKTTLHSLKAKLQGPNNRKIYNDLKNVRKPLPKILIITALYCRS
jgi:hypothetical protein